MCTSLSVSTQIMITQILLLALTARQVLSAPSHKTCQPVFGDKTIHSYQLYPENAWFDTERCLVYFSVLYNSTVAAYDPYKDRIVSLYGATGLSGDPSLHSSGVKMDPLGRLSIVINAGSPFNTRGKDISGDNFLVKYDLVNDRELWRKNISALTNNVYTGYQDIEHDELGNTFVLGSFPSSIIRISADGSSIEPWYLKSPPKPDHTIQGFEGLAKNGNTLVVADLSDGRLYRMDLACSKGTPVHIPITKGDNFIGAHTDAIILPSRYSGTVLLISDNTNGTYVLRSRDGRWKEAENLGVIPNSHLENGGSTVASVQIGDAIYAVTEFFGDVPVENSLAGNRTAFPLVDITLDVERLLR